MKFFLLLSAGLSGALISTLFDPITIATIIGGLLLAGAMIAYLTLEDVRSWVRQNLSWNRHRLAWLIKQARQSGRIPVITGFFDETTETVTAHKDYKAENVDSQISALQTGVVYELQ
jgi:hypothetical protein